MAINAKQTLLLFALLPMFPSSMATESNAAELVRPDVHFPCIVGDPARVDPFSALIRLSGGRDPSSRFNKDGQWQLKNAVGPFGDIDIWIDKRERPASADTWGFHRRRCGDASNLKSNAS